MDLFIYNELTTYLHATLVVKVTFAQSIRCSSIRS